MNRSGFFLAVGLGLVGSGAFAGAPKPLQPSDGWEPPDFVHDLSEGDRPEQRFAARALRRQARTAVRIVENRRSGLLYDEARQELADLSREVVPLCMERLSIPHLVVPCTDLLGLLEATIAIDALQLQLEKPTSGRVERHLRQAVEDLTSVQYGAP